MTIQKYFHRHLGPCAAVSRAILAGILLLVVASHSLAQQHRHDPESAARDSLVLEQYVQLAQDSSPRVAALFRQYYARLEQIPQVGTLPDPEIMFQYHVNPMRRSSVFSPTTVTAKQMVPWFGTLAKNREYVKEVARAEWAAFQEARNELVFEVKEHWYHMHRMHHHLMIFRQNLELLDRLERQIQTRYETGRASQVDLLRIQIEQDDLQIKIENMEDQLAAMKVEFNTLLNRDPEAPVELPAAMFKNRLERTEADLRQAILSRNPELLGRRHRVEAARTAEQQARLDGRPSFGLGLMMMNKDYMYMPLMQASGPAWSASLSIRVPLYRSKYRAQQQEARIETRIAQEERSHTVNRLTAEAEHAFQQYRDARRKIALYEERLIPKTRQALNIAQADYSAGRSGFEQIIQLQQQLLDYEMKLNNVRVDQNIAVAKVEYLYGRYNVSPQELNN